MTDVNCPSCGCELSDTCRDAFTDCHGSECFEIECPNCDLELECSANVWVTFDVKRKSLPVATKDAVR